MFNVVYSKIDNFLRFLLYITGLNLLYMFLLSFFYLSFNMSCIVSVFDGNIGYIINGNLMALVHF